MAKRPPTLTEFAVIAVSPALIMTMIGALVFFLIDVLYQGKYPDRLHWTLLCFIFGSVLISRILILYGASRALIYAAGLSVATLLALQGFIEYPNLTMRSYSLFVNAALMALVWWAANKLTWDCTHIDEDRRASGQGVLAAAGLDTAPAFEEEEEHPKPKKPPKESEGVAGWFERWQRHRTAKLKQPHTPGVWVLYFALGALPLFGLGQSLIPVDDVTRRSNAFRQMAVYVASSLGLLVTTTLLGVRKYLRDRGAAMPGRMTAGWLGLGAGLIAVFIAVAAVLPRPHSETPIVTLPKWGNDGVSKKASKNALKKDGSTGDGHGTKGKTENDPNAKAGSDQGKGDAPGDSKDGDPKNQGDGDKQGDAKGNPPPGEQKDGRETQGDSKSDEGAKRESAAEPKPSPVSKLTETAGNVMKWVIWIIAALAILAGVVFFILRGLAPFTKWARDLLDWFRNLFYGNRDIAKGGSNSETVEVRVERPPPFAAFSNPFSDGTHRQQSVEELVTYSFEALDAWAWDRGLGRAAKETPLEFAQRLQREYPKLESARDVARLMTQMHYAEQRLTDEARTQLKQAWRELQV